MCSISCRLNKLTNKSKKQMKKNNFFLGMLLSYKSQADC